MKLNKTVATLSLILAIQSGSVCHAAGLTSGTLLKTASSARAAGMAEAFGANTDSIALMAYNPAGLANRNKSEIETMFQNGLVDNQTVYLGGGTSLKKGYAGASLFYLDGGEIEVGSLNGSTIQTATKKAQQEYVGTVGYGWPLTKHLGAGASIKVIHSKLVEEFSATALAGDLGLHYQTALPGLQTGVSIQNFGTKLKYESTRESLPLTLRVGAQYGTTLNGNNKLLGAVDVLFSKQEKAKVNVGAEFEFISTLSLRAGYHIDAENKSDSISGFTTGLGLKLFQYRFDYAFELSKKFNDQHMFSVGISF